MNRTFILTIIALAIAFFCYAMGNRPAISDNSDLGEGESNMENYSTDQGDTMANTDQDAVNPSGNTEQDPSNLVNTDQSAVTNAENNSEQNSSSLVNADQAAVNVQNNSEQNSSDLINSDQSSANAQNNNVNTGQGTSNAMTGDIIPGNPQKASETGNSDTTRNSEVVPSKASGI